MSQGSVCPAQGLCRADDGEGADGCQLADGLLGEGIRRGVVLGGSVVFVAGDEDESDGAGARGNRRGPRVRVSGGLDEVCAAGEGGAQSVGEGMGEGGVRAVGSAGGGDDPAAIGR